MDLETMQKYHSSTIITDEKIQAVGIDRRDFLIFISIAPLVTLPNKGDAFFQLIPVAISLFGRPLLKYVLKQFTKPKRITKPLIRDNPSRSTKMIVEEAIRANNHQSDLVNTGVFLADQLWNKYSDNKSSTVIANPSGDSFSTGEIKVQLRDEDTAEIDVQATIQPLQVPPKSQLVLDMGFKNLPNNGVKRLHGIYNTNQEAEKSGRILVAGNSKGRSVEELYEKYNRKYDGGMDNIVF